MENHYSDNFILFFFKKKENSHGFAVVYIICEMACYNYLDLVNEKLLNLG